MAINETAKVLEELQTKLYKISEALTQYGEFSNAAQKYSPYTLNQMVDAVHGTYHSGWVEFLEKLMYLLGNPNISFENCNTLDDYCQAICNYVLQKYQDEYNDGYILGHDTGYTKGWDEGYEEARKIYDV